MNYHISKTLKTKDFSLAIEQVTEALKQEQFGVATEINITNTFKEKLDIDFRNYRILGACNPKLAHHAISSEDKIGVFLPCNVMVQQHPNGDIEVSAVDPLAMMMSVENPGLAPMATEVKEKLQRVVDALE